MAHAKGCLNHSTSPTKSRELITKQWFYKTCQDHHYFQSEYTGEKLTVFFNALVSFNTCIKDGMNLEFHSN